MVQRGQKEEGVRVEEDRGASANGHFSKKRLKITLNERRRATMRKRWRWVSTEGSVTEEKEDMKKPFCMKDSRQKLGKEGKGNVEFIKEWEEWMRLLEWGDKSRRGRKTRTESKNWMTGKESKREEGHWKSIVLPSYNFTRKHRR